MKKIKTSVNIGIASQLQTSYDEDRQIGLMQDQSRINDYQVLQKKYDLLKKQTQMLKNSKKTMNQQINALKKVLFKNSDIHEVLELQHSKIFDLQTTLELLQSKYDKLLSSNGSSKQTQLAIRCKQLQRRLQQRQKQHQKQIAQLKTKMMKMNASQLYSNASYQMTNNHSRIYAGSAKNNMTPIRNNRKLV